MSKAKKKPAAPPAAAAPKPERMLARQLMPMADLVTDADALAALKATPGWAALTAWMVDLQQDLVDSLIKTEEQGEFKRGMIQAIHSFVRMPDEVMDERNERVRAEEARAAKPQKPKPPILS